MLSPVQAAGLNDQEDRAMPDALIDSLTTGLRIAKAQLLRAIGERPE